MPHKDKDEYNSYLNNYMKKRWTIRRAKAIEFLGGKCARCDKTEGLEFDHIDPSTKIMAVAKASSRSEAFFWEEVEKCQLLCSTHHIEKTGEDLARARQYTKVDKRN